MATEYITRLNQVVAAINKKTEVKRTRSSGEKSVVVMDPSYPTAGLRINTSTGSKIFDFDVQNGLLELWGTDGKKGFAMRADPNAREEWIGAILGKALAPLSLQIREGYCA